MADLPKSLIEDANADIVGVISRYLPIRKTGKNYSACCPFHKERSPSFTVNAEKAMYYCFGCGAGGDAVKFVMEFESLSFRDAVEKIVGNLPADLSARREQLVVAAERMNYPPSHRTNPEKAAADLSRATLCETHPLLIRENTSARGPVRTVKGCLTVPLCDRSGELVNLAAFSQNGSVFYSAGGPSFGATARMPAALNDSGRVILCCDYFAGWRLWWKLKGECEVRACVDPDVFVWTTRKMRSTFNAVGVVPDDAEEYRELGFEVFELPDVYCASENIQ